MVCIRHFLHIVDLLCSGRGSFLALSAAGHILKGARVYTRPHKFGPHRGSLVRSPGVQNRGELALFAGSLSAEPEPSRTIETHTKQMITRFSHVLLDMSTTTTYRAVLYYKDTFFFAHWQPSLLVPRVFLALSAVGHAVGGGSVHYTQVWAPAGLRGARSGRSKSRRAGSFRGIVFRRARAKQDDGNPHRTSDSQIFACSAGCKKKLAPRLAAWPSRISSVGTCPPHTSSVGTWSRRTSALLACNSSRAWSSFLRGWCFFMCILRCEVLRMKYVLFRMTNRNISHTAAQLVALRNYACCVHLLKLICRLSTVDLETSMFG